MRLFDYTAATPEKNLAIDEALLLDRSVTAAVRLWESPDPMVVMGRSTRRREEINLAVCERHGVPVLRRVSGGASIVAGSGCLMYAIVIDASLRADLNGIGSAHRFVLPRLVEALAPLESTVQVAGTSDLAVQRNGVLLKCSGNSMRLARGRLLYHGTLLYDFSTGLLDELLLTAPRQPQYREGRGHGAFVTNLAATREEIARRLAETWSAEAKELPDTVREASERLTKDRYGRAEWSASR